jgi:VanZ family protein
VQIGYTLRISEGRNYRLWRLRHGVADATMTIGDGYGALAMNADVKSRFRAGAKVCSGVIVVLLVIAALGPAKWAPRTELGWQFDHFIGYFGITLFVCLAWPRPFVVGGVIMAIAALLESLQALTPDRSANLEAALWGAGGALAAGVVAELFLRAWRKAAHLFGPPEHP